MNKLATCLLVACAAISATAAQCVDAERATDVEIRKEPIAGIYNAPWFNYLADIKEAEKELGNDLEGASDAEDRSDAWEEYRTELVDADKDYVQEMRERGYRAGRVTVG
ncbi:MAG TPA: hypothetical protein VGN36_01000 [Sphingorhabdus sp.]|jgi:hypothetical protein|nr:hypothetical protein [Sphingorhabdus sp.]